MSFILLGILNAQAVPSGPAYRIQIFGQTNNEAVYAIQTDSSGNVYLFGQDRATTRGTFVIKTDKSGSLLFSKKYVFGDKASQFRGLGAISTGGQIYIGQPVFDLISETSTNDISLAQIDSAGALQWQRSLGLDPDNDDLHGIVTDSSNNAIISGSTTASGGFAQAVVAKYNSSGTIQWQRFGAADPDSADQATVAVDSSDNVYVAARTNTGVGNDNVLVLKYNSSGTLQWQRLLNQAFGNSFFGPKINIDSNDDVYVVGLDDFSEVGDDAFIFKLNSAGTLQWQRSLTSADILGFTGIDFDSLDNVYVSGKAAIAGENQLLLVKYNSSGVIQYQRTFGGTANDEEAFTVYIDAEDNILIGGSTRSAGVANADAIVSLLPNDGSLTGTYSIDSVDFVYASSSYTDSASSFSLTTPSVSEAAGDLTDAAASATATDRTYTEFITLLT